ncbi:MAG TPA: lytic transglycosylase domain-containing protein [Candidatus Elarobacter sp.]|jgi:soluble lytic murein transglycosylase-like protein|nr:lytic transglycosylase domain-containing protein [Candidatus Elarobacter sp.]
MDVFADIAAVQARIAEITGTPAPGSSPAPSPAGFAGALAGALGTAPAPSTAPSAGPAPVPPAQLDALVEQNAATWQVDPALVKAVIANESGFDANATSGVGAQGLMQLMPETAASLGVRDPYDPAQNVAGGTRYLRGLLDRFGGDKRLAIAAYNAGPGAVAKYGDVPPYRETRNYVQNVLASFDKYSSGAR